MRVVGETWHSIRQKHMAKSTPLRNSRTTESPAAVPSPESLSRLAPRPAACALAGAFCGFAAWLVYGCVETVLSLGVQWVRYPEAAVMGWQWPLIALVLGIYAAAGVALGGAGGLLFRETPHIAAVFTVAAALFLNLVLAWRVGTPEVLALGMTAALAILFFAALISKPSKPSKPWRPRAELFSSPWAVSLLALSAPVIRQEADFSGTSAMVKNALALTGVAAVLSIAILLARLRRGSPWSAARQVASALAVLAVFAIIVEAGGHRRAYAKPAVASTPGSPNVVLITMDAVRADHVSVYGYARDTTPNLRQFAGRATVYSRAFATSDFTLPTHASIFTGLYPAFHGAVPVPKSPRRVAVLPLGPRPATVAGMLAARGYGTVAVVANHAYLAPWTGLLRGFAVADWTRPVTLSADNQEFYLRETVRRVLRLASIPNGFDRVTMTAADVNRVAERLLDRMSPDAPFFLFLNYMDAHDYFPASPFDRYFPGKQSNFDMHRELARLSLDVNSRERPLLPEAKAHLISQYDGGIAAEDASIAELLGWLGRRNALDNTLVIVMSDHGEAFGEHSLLGHARGSVHQTQIAIPLIVKYPHQNEGRRSDRLVSEVDVAPTIFDLVGLPRPKDLPGKNLMEPGSGSEAVYARASATKSSNAAIPRFQGIRRTILSGSLKLITWTQGPPELYDLASDPGEEHNLYQPGDPRAEALLHSLANWEVGAPHPAVAPSALDRSTLERLKTLGYVQ
jgi:arylsulfatase A-like enzyme